MKAPYYRREDVEALALGLLHQLQEQLGQSLELPVDVDAVGEQVLGLSWLYEPIPEPDGTTIFGALHPERRLVVLNERHAEAFGRFDGLERFTKAHELGHWVCHVMGSYSYSPSETDEPSKSRSKSKIDGVSPEFGSIRDQVWLEKHADWFAAALLMPPLPLRKAAEAVDVSRWPGRYELRTRFGVSISALNARLSQLGFPPAR